MYRDQDSLHGRLSCLRIAAPRSQAAATMAWPMLLEVAAFLLGSSLKQTATRKPTQLKPASQCEIMSDWRG